MWNVLAIATGGAVGALSRYGLSNIIQRALGSGFAWGTLAVNLIGCLLIGLAYHLASTTAVPAPLRFLVVVGFLGAFTTFSTFGLETSEFLRDGQITIAGLYVVLSNLLGVGMVLAGLWIGHQLHTLLR